MTEKFKVQWKQIDSSTFMYGTTITLVDDEVHFENLLMPSGTIIHRWSMTTSYFSERSIPTLPILKRGMDYRMTFQVTEYPKDTVYFKINFYRRNDTLIETIVLENKSEIFTYPLEAYTYTIEMLSASVESFHFTELMIEELREEGSKTANYDLSTHSLNIVIKEPSPFNHQLTSEMLNHIENAVVMEEPDTEQFLKRLNHVSLNFIGYGKISNESAIRLAEKYQGTAYISHHGGFKGNVYSTPINNVDERYGNTAYYLKQLKIRHVE